jgi:hypothetical protein
MIKPHPMLNSQRHRINSEAMVIENQSESNYLQSDQKLNLTQARKLLRVSPNKMSQLVRTGALPYTQDPLDERVKLVNKRDVEALLKKRVES